MHSYIEIEKKRKVIEDRETSLNNLYFELTSAVLNIAPGILSLTPPQNLINAKTQIESISNKIETIREKEARLQEVSTKAQEISDINKHLHGEYESSSFEFTVRLYEHAKKNEIEGLKQEYKEISSIDDQLFKDEEQLKHLESRKGKYIVERIKLKLRKSSLTQSISKQHKRRINKLSEISLNIMKKYDSYKDLLVDTDSLAVKKELDESIALLRHEQLLTEEKQSLEKELKLLQAGNKDYVSKTEEEIKKLKGEYRKQAIEYGREIYYVLLTTKQKHPMQNQIKLISSEIGMLEQDKFSLLDIQRDYKMMKLRKRLSVLIRIRETLHLDQNETNKRLDKITKQINEINSRIGTTSSEEAQIEQTQKESWQQ
ncbi:MAG: hypothetical protein HY606_11745 [Planctomycetes bacterium]|nr:hypothetical protein [Planctomycetota bacterium]